MILSIKRITKVLTRLRGCACLSVPVLYTNQEDRFSHKAHIKVWACLFIKTRFCCLWSMTLFNLVTPPCQIIYLLFPLCMLNSFMYIILHSSQIFLLLICRIPVNSMLQAKWKTVWILISWLLRSQLIWVYTVLKI